MKIGKVIGQVKTGKTAEALKGQRLVVVEQEGGSFVATDHAGATVGDRVLFVAGSGAARLEMGSCSDVAVVAVVEEV